MLLFYLATLETDEERDKFTYLYEEHKDLLMRLAKKHLLDYPELAEDAVHDAFIKAIKYKDEILIKTSDDFERWSITVVTRKCIDIQRRRKVIDQSTPIENEDDIELASDDEPFDIAAIKQENHVQYMELLEKLGPTSSQLLEMKYYAEMTYAEISDETGMTHAQIAGRLQRARTKMKILIKSLGDMNE